MFSKARKPQSSQKPTAAEKTPDRPRVPSIISADLRILGNLKTDGDVQVDGIVDGDIETNLLTVGSSATINGTIVGEVIRVAGTVNGEITGRVVELTRTARITGDINHHSLAIEAGAFVQGLCRRLDSNTIEGRAILEAPKPSLVVSGADGKGSKPGDGPTKAASG